jgi:glycosyltransferase involved in cell wall biosynthesis
MGYGFRIGFGLIMNISENYDLTYVTIDSLAEGVGSSQITPLITRLSKADLKICLISYEKSKPELHLQDYFKSLGVNWIPKTFGSKGFVGGLQRLNDLRREIPKTKLIHARSDIPAVSSIFSNEAPVLWDVRSLWADQKILIQKSNVNNSLYKLYRSLEGIAAANSASMSTLTSAVVPILEQRHRRLPTLRIVVPTTVDLNRFKLVSKMPSTLKVLFSGTYNEYYDLELSRIFMEEFRKRYTVVTDWARPPESEKNHLGVGESRIFPSPQTGMAEVIPQYSFGVSVCKLDAGPSLAAAMPTKIAEFLACGRPIVVNRGLGDMDMLIEKFNIGVVLDGNPMNLTAGIEKIVELILDPETPFRCRTVAEQHFNMDIASKKYRALYSQMSIT